MGILNIMLVSVFLQCFDTRWVTGRASGLYEHLAPATCYCCCWWCCVVRRVSWSSSQRNIETYSVISISRDWRRLGGWRVITVATCVRCLLTALCRACGDCWDRSLTCCRRTHAQTANDAAPSRCQHACRNSTTSPWSPFRASPPTNKSNDNLYSP